MASPRGRRRSPQASAQPKRLTVLHQIRRQEGVEPSRVHLHWGGKEAIPCSASCSQFRVWCSLLRLHRVRNPVVKRRGEFKVCRRCPSWIWHDTFVIILPRFRGSLLLSCSMLVDREKKRVATSAKHNCSIDQIQLARSVTSSSLSIFFEQLSNWHS